MKKISFLTFMLIFTVFVSGCSEKLIEKLLYTDTKQISKLGIVSLVGDKLEAAYRDKDQNSVNTKVHDISSWAIDDFIEEESKIVLEKYTSYDIKVIDAKGIDLNKYYGDDNNETTMFVDESIKNLIISNDLDHIVVIELGDYLPEDDIDIVGAGIQKVKKSDFQRLVVVANIHAKMYRVYKNNLELLKQENIAISKKIDSKIWADSNKSLEPGNLYALEKIVKDLLKNRVVKTSLKSLGFTIFTFDHSLRESNKYE